MQSEISHIFHNFSPFVQYSSFYLCFLLFCSSSLPVIFLHYSKKEGSRINQLPIFPLPPIHNPILIRHDTRPFRYAHRRFRIQIVHLPLDLLHPGQHLPARAEIVPVRNPRRPGNLPPAVGNSPAILIPIPSAIPLNPSIQRSETVHPGRPDDRRIILVCDVQVDVAGDAAHPPGRAVLPHPAAAGRVGQIRVILIVGQPQVVFVQQRGVKKPA